ncbi:MAG: AMP-binding protein [Motiliproteus sp.]
MLYPSSIARSTPDKIAYKMCHTGETVTYGQLEARSNQAAHLFRSKGLQTGDHVVLLMENNRQFLEVCFAADRSGLYYTAVSTRLLPSEIEYIVNDCKAKAFITSSNFSSIAEELLPLMPSVTARSMVGGRISGYESWEESCEKQPATPILDEAQGVDMLYSSGTTGRPKGIKWPMSGDKPGELTMLVDLLGNLYDYEASTRYLSPAPLYHAAPLRHSMTVIKLGGSVFIMDHFDAEQALWLIEKEQINCSQWVPTMFVRMLKLSDEIRNKYDVTSLKVAIHAAAPCPIPVKEKMIAWWGPIIYEYYAGTENNGFCAINTEEWQNHKGSVGRAILGELHICDDSGDEVPEGATGTIYFANGHDFSYLNDIEKTKKSRNKMGWTTLGDIGRIDADGYLYLVDRKDFVIISGGVNIYPQEAENILINHPKVLDVAVIGIPNEDFGEEVKAVIQPVNIDEAGPALEAELIDYCRCLLSSIKCPRSIDFEEQLPRHATGKLYKRLIQEQYRARLASA